MHTLTNYLFEVGTLRKIARSHRQPLLTDDLSDNIASHSFRVAIIAYFLAKREHGDATKTVLMALFHDIPESRSGDQNWVHKKYVKVFEDEIIRDQSKNLDEKDELLEIYSEYGNRQSLESKLAKDADILDQILLVREYQWQGNNEASSWLSDKDGYTKKLFSKTSKKLAKEITTQKPTDWWSNIWSNNRR